MKCPKGHFIQKHEDVQFLEAPEQDHGNYKKKSECCCIAILKMVN